ncbi:MAG: septum formation initiator family protein [Leptospiraceae bacterium]|nr:septum formation initiator family protein [Leptospiraceae bacterium]MCP5513401.1 septum formation initiator family protein [Leptospiraceae bacterium]
MNAKIPSLLGLILVFGMLYFTILGSTGIIERRNLENRMKLLKDEVERLESENKALAHRDRMLSSEEEALESEAGRHYLLTEDSRIIKFKEMLEVESEEQILSSPIPLATFQNKKTKNRALSLQFLKVFYLIVVGVFSVSVFFRFKK